MPAQIEGLQFLVRAYENGVSAILGDEMGLGARSSRGTWEQWSIGHVDGSEIDHNRHNRQ